MEGTIRKEIKEKQKKNQTTVIMKIQRSTENRKELKNKEKKIAVQNRKRTGGKSQEE